MPATTDDKALLLASSDESNHSFQQKTELNVNLNPTTKAETTPSTATSSSFSMSTGMISKALIASQPGMIAQALGHHQQHQQHNYQQEQMETPSAVVVVPTPKFPRNKKDPSSFEATSSVVTPGTNIRASASRPYGTTSHMKAKMTRSYDGSKYGSQKYGIPDVNSISSKIHHAPPSLPLTERQYSPEEEETRSRRGILRDELRQLNNKIKENIEAKPSLNARSGSTTPVSTQIIIGPPGIVVDSSDEEHRSGILGRYGQISTLPIINIG